MTMPQMSRRQVLTVAGVSLGVGVIELGVPASPASAAEPAPTLEPVGDQAVSVLSGDGAAPAARPRQLAVRVVRTSPLPAGTRLTVTFDSRLYASAQPAVVMLDGRAVAASSAITTDAGTGLSICTVDLAEPVSAAGDLVAVMGTAHPLLYPRDLIRKPAGVSADVRSTLAARRHRRSLQPPRPPSFGGPAQPWGVELSAVWGRKTWGDGERFRYHYPTRITLHGVGPGTSPVPMSIAVSVDPQVVADIQVVSTRLNGKQRHDVVRPQRTTRAVTLLQARWRLVSALGPDDSLDVALQVTTKNPNGPLSTIKHPVVELGGSDAGAAQRRTGRESLSRLDAAWE